MYMREACVMQEKKATLALTQTALPHLSLSLSFCFPVSVERCVCLCLFLFLFHFSCFSLEVCVCVVCVSVSQSAQWSAWLAAVCVVAWVSQSVSQLAYQFMWLSVCELSCLSVCLFTSLLPVITSLCLCLSVCLSVSAVWSPTPAVTLESTNFIYLFLNHSVTLGMALQNFCISLCMYTLWTQHGAMLSCAVLCCAGEETPQEQASCCTGFVFHL